MAFTDDPDAQFLGVTDNLNAVKNLAAQTPEGMTLAIDLDLARRQAQLLCGEDKALAIALVQTVFMMTEMHTDLLFDPETGHLYGNRAGDSPEEDTYLRGCTVGKAAGLLQLLSLWPDDPLDLYGLPLRDTEKRLSELWTGAAERLGVVATIFE